MAPADRGLVCRHAVSIERGAVTCRHELYEGRPHVGTCLVECPVRDAPVTREEAHELVAMPLPQVQARDAGRGCNC